MTTRPLPSKFQPDDLVVSHDGSCEAIVKSCAEGMVTLIIRKMNGQELDYELEAAVAEELWTKVPQQE